MRRRLLLLAVTLWIGVPAAAALTPDEERGREIYRRGASTGLDTGTATVGDGAPLPATALACAGCHGPWGEGRREGGVEAPALDWPRLSSRAVSPATGRTRGPYTGATLRRAILDGVDPSGAPLHAAMPRYRMPAARVAELIAYLQRIGGEGDTDPGVTETSVHVGAALPMSGPLEAAGRGVQAVLRGVFDGVNAGGGVFGRRIALTVEDSRGDPSATEDAVRTLVDGHRVFALVGSFEPAAGEAATRLLAEVPLVGPLTISPLERPDATPLVFDLLPSMHDQARALVDFLVERRAGRPSRVAIVHGATVFDLDVLAGARAQAAARALAIVAEEPVPGGPDDADGAVARLGRGRPDAVLFVGDASGLVTLARAMARAELDSDLLSFVATAGAGALRLPPDVARRAFFASPTAPPEGPLGAELLAILRASPVPRQYLGFQTAAFAAAKVFVEGLRLGGRRLSRAGLASALERLQHLDTGVTAPVTFRANRHRGTAGAAILAVDPQRNELVLVHRWLAPRDPP